MFKYIVETYENNEWQKLNDVVLPITDGDVLDETLAEGKVDVKNTARSTSLKPMTRLRIKCYEDGVFKGKIQRVVGTSRKTRKRLVGSPLFDYEAQTLELTKIMERIVIGSMTSTKWLEHNYQGGSAQFSDTGTTGTLVHINDSLVPSYNLIYKTGETIQIPQAGGIASSSQWDTWLTISGFSGVNYKGAIVTNEIKKGNTTEAISIWSNDNSTADTSISYTFDSDGSYQITTYWAVYVTQSELDTDNPSIEGSYTWSFSVYTQKHAQPQNYIITSIVNRLLSAGKTRRHSDNPLISFNAEQATKYSQAPYDNPPEFAFTNSTLLDALMQIGGAIHAIPRLQCVGESEDSEDLTYEVVFDELGGNEDISANMPAFVYEDKNYDINDYSGELDSPAQNLVNSQNIEKGCVSEFGKQYITVRTESAQVEISADTMALQLSSKIQQLVRLYCKYGNEEYDITPYVYESEEYQTLSTLENSTYPYSIGYALCYKKGGNTITGLNSKITTATVLTKWKTQYAILNILRAVTGNSSLTISRYIDLAFRVVYVPIIETRLTHRKPFADGTEDITLVYNQGANLVETSAYGQKLRGAVARLGQEITRRTYDFFSFSNLPKVGQIIDGSYIAQVNYAFYVNKIRVTVTLTPNFNLLSHYVGLNTNYRLSDISQEQIANRFITYGETLVFGNSETSKQGTIISKSLAGQVVHKILDDTQPDISRIDTAMTESIDEDGNIITDTAVLLPVVSFPFGTSWAFVCAFLDNYGAGYQATDEFQDNSEYKRVQRLVPYTDAVGEIAELNVWWNNRREWENDGNAVADGGQANIYPLANSTVKGNYKANSPMTTADNPFVLLKDSKERIGIVYQMHLQANRETIVIGSALADNCPLCTNVTDAPTIKAYVLDHTINTFGNPDIVVGTNAQETTYSVDSNGTITVAPVSGFTARAWVIADTNGNIYIGENNPTINGSTYEPIYISTK